MAWEENILLHSSTSWSQNKGGKVFLRTSVTFNHNESIFMLIVEKQLLVFLLKALNVLTFSGQTDSSLNIPGGLVPGPHPPTQVPKAMNAQVSYKITWYWQICYTPSLNIYLKIRLAYVHCAVQCKRCETGHILYKLRKNKRKLPVHGEHKYMFFSWVCSSQLVEPTDLELVIQSFDCTKLPMFLWVFRSLNGTLYNNGSVPIFSLIQKPVVTCGYWTFWMWPVQQRTLFLTLFVIKFKQRYKNPDYDTGKHSSGVLRMFWRDTFSALSLNVQNAHSTEFRKIECLRAIDYIFFSKSSSLFCASHRPHYYNLMLLYAVILNFMS